ncbi:MAG: hypothetical protein KME64_17715 [Scytonematopsis contorta HA4267-MV1]|jgi:hypothetical protein|nr:hypothetical protein [Scytonematopsis contorta HA4267-MV1]
MQLTKITFKGLEIAPSQVHGAIRIVPLLRREVRGDLRLLKRSYEEDLAIVSLEKDMKYLSYVPHGLVMSWTKDGSAVTNFGGDMMKSDGKRLDCRCASVRLMQRMVKREAKNELRFLPLHLAMEGFLSLYFNGPKIAWEEYSKYALSYGLGCRYESFVSGRDIAGLEDALRVFEIHTGQVGVLVYVAEALASVFVVPTPEDYRALHNSLIEDFYGELIYQYALTYNTTYPIDCKIDESRISNLADLRIAVDKMRLNWASFQSVMANGFLDRELNSKTVYNANPFTLQRFITNLEGYNENYIGEAIVRDNGELEYLHTYRLSDAQTRRARYLSKLEENNWNLHKTASSLSYDYQEFVQRMEKEGFGYLFKQQVRDKARKR